MLGKLLKRKKKDASADGEEAKTEGAASEEKQTDSKEEGGEAKEGEAEGEAAPKKGKRKIVIIGAAVVLLLVIVGALFGLGVIGGGGDEESHEEAATEDHGGGHGGGHGEGAPVVVNAPVYYELPEFLVNLSSVNNRTSFLKMRVTLELKDQLSVAIVEANKPRIVDTFNTYLRELRPQDVQGSAGIYRLRDELLTRMNGTIQEGLVKDILFSEIIVQ